LNRCPAGVVLGTATAARILIETVFLVLCGRIVRSGLAGRMRNRHLDPGDGFAVGVWIMAAATGPTNVPKGVASPRRKRGERP